MGREECAKSNFRRRFWGSIPVFAQSFFSDSDCWRRHLSLDPFTGSDPPDIKLRSAQGFEAADFFMSAFWVWDKLIENLADVGYDASNMVMMSYDWRLSFEMLEKRDGYFTKLKHTIEAYKKTSGGTKVVLVSHSMGSQVVLFFFKWVTTKEKDGGGGGGKDWVEKHIHVFTNIAGPLLGVPKAVSALLSGEMKDTAVLFGTMGQVIEHFFGRKKRKDLWNTWGSLWAMLPMGGDAIWGSGVDIMAGNRTSIETTNTITSKNSVNGDDDSISAPSIVKDNTDLDLSSISITPFITIRNFIAHPEKFNTSSTTNNELQQESDMSRNNDVKNRHWTLVDSIEYLQNWGGGYGSKLHSTSWNNSYKKGKSSKVKWHDPTVTPLPHAPSMKIYCLYGTGIETERSYFYYNISTHMNEGQNDDLQYLMDTSVNNPESNIRHGTRFSDGDVSVPLLSLGFMCVDGWKKNKKLNPSNADIITREYKHKEEFQVNDPMRGGPFSSDHVDILGNIETTTDILKIVTDHERSTVVDRLTSDINKIASTINMQHRKSFKHIFQRRHVF
eukprot:CAMPEP_0184874214 /NCGR_PEP_ID=MMETSP0580-20130426/42267_1 /TAXON_ID=1118495 /ORGANISM="Dactyliosolen fragilissimus" /LENGTH=556 /DNA_ID=CAMNT_0027377195 /DNA_START=526 /DNA_END=2197 /DNA_ORIENTATION=-